MNWRSNRTGAWVACCVVVTVSIGAAAQEKLQGVRPLEPDEAIKSIRVKPGFRVELVACEPQVMDPVAFAWDERGRLFVAEMRGYPNGGVGEGEVSSGRIKMLEDRNGDGQFETSTVFADGLRLPMGLCCWGGGLIVANPPDILYLKDTDGDGRADERRVLFSGFGIYNLQQMANGLQFGVDNWIYGANGGNAGDVSCPEFPARAAVASGGRHFRFHMADLAFETLSGGGQYGLAADDFQRWFTSTNAAHLKHVVLPDQYLRRNPYFAAPAVTIDIPDHGAAARLFRASPPEAWRVARTKMRAESTDRAKFALTELVPGGYVTAACGNVIYRGGLFPPEFRGNSFVCDAANNLIHRDVLVPSGATFIAKRADDEADCEFLASTDNWFRPVFLANGPDGALVVADFYREIIETPLSLPDEIKQHLDLERGHDRGRIWRIVPENATPSRSALKLAGLKTSALVEQLASPNSWVQMTAHRLLFERRDESAIESLKKLAAESKLATARLSALWLLEGFGALDTRLIERATKDESAGVREHAVRLVERHADRSPLVVLSLLPLVDDPNARVRFQLALSLGSITHQAVGTALATLAERDGGDPWARAAIMSSARERAPELMVRLTEQAARRPEVSPHLADVVRQFAEIVGAKHADAEVAQALEYIALARGDDKHGLRLAALDGVATGLTRGGSSLRKALEGAASGPGNRVAPRINAMIERSSAIALDAKEDPAKRVTALRLVGAGVSESQAAELAKLLSVETPQAVQLAAVRALSTMNSDGVGKMLVAGWRGFSPPLRREVQEAIFARADRLPVLLDAIESGEVAAGEIDAARRDQLLNQKDAAIKARAAKLLASLIPADRQKVIDEFATVLTLPGDAARGAAVFKKHCATCHRLKGDGVEVGADLTAIRTKTREMLLIDILDPSRAMEPRFTNYVVSTKSGQVLTGMITAETATSLTLRRAELVEDTLLRSDIDEIRSTGKSLMPDGLERSVSHEELADLMEFLRTE